MKEKTCLYLNLDISINNQARTLGQSSFKREGMHVALSNADVDRNVEKLLMD